MAAALALKVRRLPQARLYFGSLIAALVLSVSFLMLSKQSGRPLPSSSSVDPRLVIHPARTPLHAILSNGIVVTGSLSPTIPGKNEVRLVMGGAGTHRPAVIILTAAMVGMRMLPTRATLTRSGGNIYTGTITLPMFGAYRESVVVTTPAGTQRGIITVKLPLPGT